jgi:molybdate transport system substrate-binding protein
MTMLRFLSAGAAQAFVSALASRNEQTLEGHFGAVGAMLEKFRAGEPCDVVVLTHAQVAELVAEGKALGETATDLGEVPTAIGVPAEMATPDVSNEAALRATLLGADEIYFPDPVKATAGIHFAKVIDDLGIYAQVKSRLRAFPNGAAAMKAMAEAASKKPIVGCTQATEILATPGVRLVGPLPRGFDLATVYTAAVNTRAPSPDGARRFVAAICADASREMRQRAGFEGFSARVATEADFDTIRDIVQRVLAEYGLACDPADTDRDLADIRSSYFARGGLFDVIVSAEGAIVGCCGVYPVDPGTCELRKMYLLDSVRGHGLGARLLHRALAFARGQGFRRMELETASVLKNAIGLYTREGFKPIERTHLAGRCDQAYALEL